MPDEATSYYIATPDSAILTSVQHLETPNRAVVKIWILNRFSLGIFIFGRDAKNKGDAVG